MTLSRRSSRVLVSMIILVFFLACSTRRSLLVSDIELKEGDTIYSLICNSGDCYSFLGYRVCDSLLSDSLVVELIFEGKGAVFQDGIIDGVVADGSEMVFSIDSIQTVEMNYFDGSKTLKVLLFAIAGIMVILTVLPSPSNEDLLPSSI